MNIGVCSRKIRSVTILLIGLLSCTTFYLLYNSYSRPTPVDPQLEDLLSNFSKIYKIKSHGVLKRLLNTLTNLPDLLTPPPDLVNRKENDLLSTAVPPVLWLKYTNTWHGMSLPVITSKPWGRLGNVMGGYATIYAIQRIYNVSSVIIPFMRSRLSYFPNLSLPDIPVCYWPWSWQYLPNEGPISDFNYTPIELAAAGLLGPDLFVLTEYPIEIQLFHQFRKDLINEFTFSEDITSQVEDFLHGVVTQRQSQGHLDVVFIGFHVRRTDYAAHALNDFGAALPEVTYFSRAMQYYRDKFPGKVVFIAASDDEVYLREQIGQHNDVIFSPGKSPEFDLALLTSCNHSIVTLGSYGFWSGFLAGGEVVYPDINYTSVYRFSRYMYERIGLSSFTPLRVD